MNKDNEYLKLISSMDFFKSKKKNCSSIELNLVHMNEKTFNVLSKIYLSEPMLHFRDLVRKSNLSYGTVQGIIKKSLNILNMRVDGKNKYYSLKNNLDTFYLKQEIEIKITREFLKNNQNFVIFFKEISKLNIPILIFRKNNLKKITEKINLNIISFSNKNFKISNKIQPYKINHINIKPNDLKKFKLEIDYNKISKNHIIINGFDFILNEVFNK